MLTLVLALRYSAPLVSGRRVGQQRPARLRADQQVREGERGGDKGRGPVGSLGSTTAAAASARNRGASYAPRFETRGPLNEEKPPRNYLPPKQAAIFIRLDPE